MAPVGARLATDFLKKLKRAFDLPVLALLATKMLLNLVNRPPPKWWRACSARLELRLALLEKGRQTFLWSSVSRKANRPPFPPR